MDKSLALDPIMKKFFKETRRLMAPGDAILLWDQVIKPEIISAFEHGYRKGRLDEKIIHDNGNSN